MASGQPQSKQDQRPTKHEYGLKLFAQQQGPESRANQGLAKECQGSHPGLQMLEGIIPEVGRQRSGHQAQIEHTQPEQKTELGNTNLGQLPSARGQRYWQAAQLGDECEG